MKHQNPISTISVLSLFLFFLYPTRGTSAAPPPSEEDFCSDELVRFSVCLPFISSAPNNLTDTPPVQCCNDFSSAYASNHSLCLCYLLRQPPILGFPISSSLFFQLPSLCPNTSGAHISLQSLCSGSVVLPPLHSITGLDHGRPKSHPEQQSQAENGGSLDDYITPEPTADSPTEPNSVMPTSNSSVMTNSTRSSAIMLMKKICHWGPLSVIFFCLPWSGTIYLMNI